MPDWGLMFANLVNNWQAGKNLYDQEQELLQKQVDEQAARDWLKRQREQQIAQDERNAALQTEQDAFNNQLVGEIDPQAPPLYRSMKLGTAVKFGYKYKSPEERAAEQKQTALQAARDRKTFYETMIKDPAVLAKTPGYVKAVRELSALMGAEAPVETVGRIPEVGAYQQVTGMVPPTVSLEDLVKNPESVKVPLKNGVPDLGGYGNLLTFFAKKNENKPPTTDEIVAGVLLKLQRGEQLTENDKAILAAAGKKPAEGPEDARVSGLRKELSDLRGNVETAIKSGNAGLATQAIGAYNARLGEVQQYVPDAAKGFLPLDTKSITQYIPNEAEATRALIAERNAGAATKGTAGEKPLTYKDALALATDSWRMYSDQYNKQWKDRLGRLQKGAPPYLGQDEWVQAWLQEYAPQFLSKQPPSVPAGGESDPGEQIKALVAKGDLNGAIDVMLGPGIGNGSIMGAWNAFSGNANALLKDLGPKGFASLRNALVARVKKSHPKWSPPK